jgi:riboflavin kinase/FMN adenylyltransferase
MQVLQQTDLTQIPRSSVCVAIGFFDGVHLGHQQIISRTISEARATGTRSLVVTFRQHPSTIVSPHRVPPLIYSVSQRLHAIEALGTDAVFLIDFDKPFSELTGEGFVSKLVHDLGPIQSICVGENFHFGRQRGGNVDLLRRLGPQMGFLVHGLPSLSREGDIVSSTRIREAIRGGDFTTANGMLGRNYSFCGNVVAGEKIGRTLGFPTANLEVAGKALPPRGVYRGETSVGSRKLKAVVNIGLRPTIAQTEPQLRFEVHLLDFDGDLYGVELEVTLEEKLRDEQKFGSREALREQISRDVARARECQ